MVEASLKVHCTDSSIMKFSAEPSSSACAHAHSEEAIRNEKAKAARPAVQVYLRDVIRAFYSLDGGRRGGGAVRSSPFASCLKNKRSPIFQSKTVETKKHVLFSTPISRSDPPFPIPSCVALFTAINRKCDLMSCSCPDDSCPSRE